MKKLLLLAISSLLAVSLTACGEKSTPSVSPTPEGTGSPEVSGSSEYTGPTEWIEATSREISTLDYVVTALATNHEVNVNLIDGLLEHDNKGLIVPGLATEWSPNEDSTVWTFKLREGVKWVTNTGEEYDEVKADDFVTGLRHGAEFNSGTAWLLQGFIKGYADYMGSDYSDAEFEKVGIKAIDDYTLEFTMLSPVPYFDSVTTYAVLYPINKTFLESMGDGCKLGAPSTESCAFGTTKPDSILYNGAYILSSFDVKSETVLVKNESYWDAENVKLETIKRVFDDGSDPYSIIKGFEQGSYVSAALNPGWEDYEDYASKYADNAYFAEPNSYVFGMVPNYNRVQFEHTNYADDVTLRENTRAAMLNTNFRLALAYSIDRVAYSATRAPLELAKATLRNINNIDGAGTMSDGRTYYTLVQEAYSKLTGNDYDLSDGQTPFFQPEKAKEYIEAAKAEGIVFPIHLDMLVPETSDALVKQGNSLKQSVEESTDGQIIIELVLRSQDVVESIAYDNMDPAFSDYDVSTFSGWGPDYQDPKSFVDIYSPTMGYYMTSIGLGTVDADGNVTELDIKEKVGLMKYEELYRKAEAITDDMDARYLAFAEADAFLLANALYTPMTQQSRGQLVSKIVPFTEQKALTGTDQYKYKGIELQDELVTVEEYNARYEEVFGE